MRECVGGQKMVQVHDNRKGTKAQSRHRGAVLFLEQLTSSEKPVTVDFKGVSQCTQLFWCFACHPALASHCHCEDV